MKLPIQVVLVSLFSLFITDQLCAQRNHPNQPPFYQNLYNNLTGELPYTGYEKQKSYEAMVANIEGSQFYDEHFNKATISNSPSTFNVRYNAFLDEMEILNKNEVVFVNKRYHRGSITLTDKDVTYKILKEIDGDQETLGYFVLIDGTGSVALYKKERKQLVYDNKLTRKNDSEFKNVRTSYYVEFDNSKIAVEVPTNKRDFADLFPEKKAEILSFIKKNKLKLRQEEDIQRLITYINSI